MREWLQFDPHSPWGTEAFEAKVPKDYLFPPAWTDAKRRVEARRDPQRPVAAPDRSQRRPPPAAEHRLPARRDRGRAGQRTRAAASRSRFSTAPTATACRPASTPNARSSCIRPSTDSEGKVVFKSGDLDPNGDVRNDHSVYVHNGELPLDKQLFSLQTKFLVRNIRGGEREQVLPITLSLDPLPYIRPETRPFTVLGRPSPARKQKQNLEANGGYR